MRDPSSHPRWREDRIIAPNGYVKVRVGMDHPLADCQGYAYEHTVVWCAAGNPPPRKDELLHHKNTCRQDNRIENLSLKKRAVHSVEHAAEQARDGHGRFKSTSASR